MTDNKNVDHELEKIFKMHLTNQYQRGIKEGTMIGGKLLMQAILDLIEDGADLERVKDYCKTKLGK